MAGFWTLDAGDCCRRRINYVRLRAGRIRAARQRQQGPDNGSIRLLANALEPMAGNPVADRGAMRINRGLLAVMPAHFGIDFITFAVNILFPLLAERLELSFTQVGIAAGLHIVANGIAQPLFGLLGDRIGHRRILVAGIFCQGLFVGLAAQAESYAVLLLFLFLSALASGAFHSLGLSAANRSSTSSKGSAVGLFFLAGNAGFAVSPVVTGFFVETVGLGTRFPLYLIGFSALTTIFFYVLTRPRAAASAPASQSPASTRDPLYRLLLPLAAMSVFRGITFGAAPVFIPFAFLETGTSLTIAGLALSIFSAGAATGVFGGGWLADRFGPKPVIAFPLLLGTPAFLLMVVDIGSPLSFAAAFVAGFLVQTPQSPSVVMVQQALAKWMGAASGAALGFIFSVQAVGQALTGLAADAIGLVPALVIVACMPVLGFAAALAVPGPLFSRSALVHPAGVA